MTSVPQWTSLCLSTAPEHNRWVKHVICPVSLPEGQKGADQDQGVILEHVQWQKQQSVYPTYSEMRESKLEKLRSKYETKTASFSSPQLWMGQEAWFSISFVTIMAKPPGWMAQQGHNQASGRVCETDNNASRERTVPLDFHLSSSSPLPSP